jgi:Na+/melibiose symporter-like transporter
MLITRQKQIPTHWVFYAQIPFVMAIAANMITGAPFIYSMKKFIDNPAAITFLLSIEVFVTVLGGPFASWLSDRVWTRCGRRKPFLIAADVGKFLIFPLIPLAPNIVWLIVLKWIYGILHDVGSPKTALTMEIVPARQRGRGSGFFNMQLQIVNLVFWGIVIGRFDDVYFSGPLTGMAALPGETLLYWAGALMFLFVLGFNTLGIKEIRPPDARRLRDELQPGQSVWRLFLAAFFKEVLHKSLLPLYLLLVVGTMTTVGLGALSPLLYTDQWGYSLQQMGTNIAIGALLSIVIALGAGYAADATSKLKVYTWALIGGLVAKLLWTAFVYTKPGMRPELWEIVAFGQLNHTFGLIAATVSFPLILEYVTRNQLGTANAGMGLFDSLIKNSFAMFVGFYVLWWSLLFLPQAGDRVEIVLAEPRDRAYVQAVLAGHEWHGAELTVQARHRPGTSGNTTRRWEIRRGWEEAGALHKERKARVNEVAKLNIGLQSPFITPDKAHRLTAQRAAAQQQLQAIESRLAMSARQFESQIRSLFDGLLHRHGAQILMADYADRSYTLAIEVVDPVDEVLAEQLAIHFEAMDLALAGDAAAGELSAEITVTPLEAPVHGLRLQVRRDPVFEELERAQLAAGATAELAFAMSSELVMIWRGVLGRNGNAFGLRTVDHATGGDDAPGPQTRLEITSEQASPELARMLDEVLIGSRRIAAAQTTAAGGILHVVVEWQPNAAPRPSQRDPVIEARLQALMPDADPYTLHTAHNLYHRLVAAAAPAPLSLVVARPVVAAEPADRRYDYFFSIQLFMILTDMLGLLVIVLIVYLEKRGTIQRVGAHEDDKR